jgi:hypothetical protein
MPDPYNDDWKTYAWYNVSSFSTDYDIAMRIRTSSGDCLGPRAAA